MKSNDFEALSITVEQQMKPGLTPLTVSGTIKDLFLWHVIHLLFDSPEFDRPALLRCPQCDRIFYRVRQQRFCSIRCANRAYMKAYRAGGNNAASGKELGRKKKPVKKTSKSSRP